MASFCRNISYSSSDSDYSYSTTPSPEPIEPFQPILWGNRTQLVSLTELFGEVDESDEELTTDTSHNTPSDQGTSLHSSRSLLKSTVVLHITDSEMMQNMQVFARIFFEYIRGNNITTMAAHEAIKELKMYGINICPDDVEYFSKTSRLEFENDEFSKVDKFDFPDEISDKEENSLLDNSDDLFDMELPYAVDKTNEQSLLQGNNIKKFDYYNSLQQYVIEHDELDLKVAKYFIKYSYRFYYGTTLNNQAHGYGREYERGQLKFTGCYLYGRRLERSHKLWEIFIKTHCSNEKSAQKAHEMFILPNI